MEKAEIIEILVESLYCPSESEQRVAYTFLREIIVRDDEPVIRRLCLAVHLAVYRVRWTASLAWRPMRSAGLFIADIPRMTKNLALSIRDGIISGWHTASEYARLFVFTVVNGYLTAWGAVVYCIVRIADFATRTWWTITGIAAEIRKHALRQVMPEAATPFVAAGLVFLVLFVFGINWYFIINDVNKKGVFADIRRFEWGDVALASMLIGEGYDIYLQEKITEKRIKELLSSGDFYERTILVTGYYSPLPDQEKYATGSYRGDIKLNGRGIIASDTTPVYLGMAAGPPHMKFGTNVIIEGLGKFDMPKIYTIHDRGGSIRGNRLDIWVGHGEDAMRKAYTITGYYKVIVVGNR